MASPPASSLGRVVVTLPDGREVRAALRELLRMGSDVDADITVDDPHVSRLHCELEPTGAGVVLRDLGSTNGTFVGGAAIKEVVLTPGVVVTLGASRFVLEIEAVGTPPTAVRFGDAVAASAGMTQVFAMLAKLAPTDVSLLLTGETGTGKDVMARGVHGQSPRAKGPFVVFDCGAVAASLIESELFGHERGAFTGAVGDRQGAFERAHGGTLFLDEIGELPLDLQPRLLRALEQRTVRRVGGDSEISVDVRVVAATNRDLGVEVSKGRFRQDLFFRLNAAVVAVPPLRERGDDLWLLVEHILADQRGSGAVHIAPAALAALRAYEWPGNVRELRNVLVTALAMVDGPLLEPRHLMFPAASRRAPSLDDLPLGGRTLELIERAAIRQTLEREGGNRTRAAKALGIAPSTLYEKIKKYGL